MVEGIDLFRERFATYSDQFTLIGGVACELVLAQAGISFRATKDLDIVLCVEALSDAFVVAFWGFVQEGEYEHKHKGTDRKQFYRFYKPRVDGFPYMLELFSRQPDALTLANDSYLTPIPTDDTTYSLSAILLNDDYYGFLQEGRVLVEGCPVVGSEYLLPLKAKAWCELTDRKAEGGAADSKDIRKHRNDVFRLFRVIDPEFKAEIPHRVREDLTQFLVGISQDEVNLADFGIKDLSLEAVLAEIRRIYNLDGRLID